MHPDRSDRDLAAELDAERANTEHWRRIARQRTETYEELKHRRLVRGALAAERLTRPMVDRAHGLWDRATTRAERLALSAAAPGPLAARKRQARLTAALAGLAEPAPLRARISVILVPESGGDDTPARAGATSRPAHIVTTDIVATDMVPSGVELIVVAPAEDTTAVEPTAASEHRVRVIARGTGESIGRSVQRAIDASTGDLVGLLATTTEPLDTTWLARLAASLVDDVAAATAVLVHPQRARGSATPHDLTVREAGLDVQLVAGAPVGLARDAGTEPDPRAAPVTVAGATGACLLVVRRRLDEAGGFPPVDDLDTGTLELCVRLRARGGRVVAVPAALALDHRPVSSFRALREPIPGESARWRALIDRAGPALVSPKPGALPTTKVSFALTVAAPTQKVAHQWGDWHLAEALAASLGRLGHATLVQTLDLADLPAARMCDVHIAIRGLAPVRRTSGQRHVLWVISHPEAIEDAELDEADLVLAASPAFAAHLRARTSSPVEILLQATDHHRFRPVRANPAHRHAITFVGKTRDVLRPVVADALAVGLRPSIYGSGWPALVDEQLIVADHVDNAQLPMVYSSAAVVLNDHWHAMRTWGFVSNRIFDVLACGVPIISDPVPGLAELFDGAVLEYHNPYELRDLIEAVHEDPERARSRAAQGRRAVLARHTFDHRARELVEALERSARDL